MLVEYLLGRLTPDEQAQVEEKAFVDDDFEEQLEATADDLIHAYLAGGLTAEDRRRFESHFLESRRHQERLAFMKDLLAAMEPDAGQP
ncbi:MAG TPA: zf-HC2 domain-containing protein, partial [Vicinamibacteria bacterium]